MVSDAESGATRRSNQAVDTETHRQVNITMNSYDS